MFVPRSVHLPQSTLARMSQSRFLRKYLGRPYCLMNICIWNHLPASFASWRPVRSYGHHWNCARQEAIRWHLLFSEPPRTGVADSLARSKASESTLNAAVPACSKGAEVVFYLVGNSMCSDESENPAMCFGHLERYVEIRGSRSVLPQESRRLGSPRSWLSRSWSFISPESHPLEDRRRFNLWRWSRPHPHNAQV